MKKGIVYLLCQKWAKNKGAAQSAPLCECAKNQSFEKTASSPSSLNKPIFFAFR